MCVRHGRPVSTTSIACPSNCGPMGPRRSGGATPRSSREREAAGIDALLVWARLLQRQAGRYGNKYVTTSFGRSDGSIAYSLE
jgi:hypothetical protein